MWSSKRSASAAHMRRLCMLGLPMEGIVPALVRALCREARCDAGVVLWFDAHGEIANLYAQHLPAPAVLALWFSPSREKSVVAFQPSASGERVRLSQLVETCADDDAERAKEVDRAAEPFCPHRHLCGMAVPSDRPLQRLCCAIVRQGSPVASLMLYRPLTTAPFGAEERAAVKAAGRYLSLHPCAVPIDTAAGKYRACGEQALLLCEPDGRVAQASANGYTLLAQASGCAINRKTVPDALERAGRDLLRRLLAGASLPAGRGARSEAHVATLVNAWGLFKLHVFFEPVGPHGVLIERVEHLLVRLVESMWHLDLSVQQGEVLLLLALGLHHEQIADRLGVSLNTADYHVRQLYSKLGAHTRNEAIACVLDTAESHVAA